MIRYTTNKVNPEAKKTTKIISQISTYLFENGCDISKTTKEKLREAQEALFKELEKFN